MVRWFLVGNDSVIKLSTRDKMGLSSNSHKRCDVGSYFEFVISKSRNRGVLYTHNTRILIYIFFILLRYLRCIQLQTLFLLTLTDEFFLNLWKQCEKSKTFISSSVKNVRKDSDIKDLQCKSKKWALHMHQGESPLLPSDCGNFQIFHYFDQL